MEELELVCFQLITFAGEAKSAYMNAIQKAKLGCYEEAENLIQEGNAAFLNAHKVHAEDQLMGTETCKIMVGELIDAYKRIDALEKKY